MGPEERGNDGYKNKVDEAKEVGLALFKMLEARRDADAVLLLCGRATLRLRTWLVFLWHRTYGLAHLLQIGTNEPTPNLT